MPLRTVLPLPEPRSDLYGMLDATRSRGRAAGTQIRIWVLDGHKCGFGSEAERTSRPAGHAMAERLTQEISSLSIRTFVSNGRYSLGPKSGFGSADDTDEDLGPKPRGPLSPPHQNKKAGRGSLPTPTCDFPGAPGPIRTADTRFRRAVLYPLSYEGMERYSSTEYRSVPTSSCRPSWPSPWHAPAREDRGASCRRGRGRDSRSACGTGGAWPSRR